MARPHRRERLASLLTEFLSSLLQREARDPRLGFASITRIEVSGDLRVARVFVSVLGDESEQRATMRALEHGSGWMRSECAARLPLRHTPELRFQLDHSIEEGDRVLQLLRELAQEPAPASGRDAAVEITLPDAAEASQDT